MYEAAWIQRPWGMAISQKPISQVRLRILLREKLILGYKGSVELILKLVQKIVTKIIQC